MNRGRLLFILGASILALLAAGAVAASLDGFAITWRAITGGGGQSSSASYVLQGSAGQAAAGVASSSGFRLGSGFWYAFGAPAPPVETATASPSASRTQMPGVTSTATCTGTPTRTATRTQMPGLTSTATRTGTPTRTATVAGSRTPTQTRPPQRMRCYLPIVMKNGTLP